MLSKLVTLENRKHRGQLQRWGGDNWLSALVGGLTWVFSKPLIHSIFIEYPLHARHFARYWEYHGEQNTALYSSSQIKVVNKQIHKW